VETGSTVAKVIEMSTGAEYPGALVPDPKRPLDATPVEATHMMQAAVPREPHALARAYHLGGPALTAALQRVAACALPDLSRRVWGHHGVIPGGRGWTRGEDEAREEWGELPLAHAAVRFLFFSGVRQELSS
jgi:hypothetical protein